MCVNAMWMCHHWFMHIETHPCLGRSHTRASTMVIMVIIRNTFDVHTTWQLFLTPPPKMGRSPRDNNFAILARIVWACCPHVALMNPVMKGTMYLPICQKLINFCNKYDFDELDASPQNAFWWGQRSHELSKLMCGLCHWSNCPSHVRTVEINQDVENTSILSSFLLELNIEYGVYTQPYINLTL